MDSASLQFVLFGLAAAIVCNFSRVPALRSGVLSLATVIFLVRLVPGPISFLPMAGFLLLGYVALFLLERGWKKGVGWSVAAVILAFVWLKKYTFLPEVTFLHSSYFILGLSYIFFRVLHLIIEAGEKGRTERVGLGAYLLYTLNFTTFVSGPIQRYDEFARDQFSSDPVPLDLSIVGQQLERIVRGFFKVNVPAVLLNELRINFLADLSQPLSAAAKAVSIFELAVIYPFFLYCNFSGYIDIVIAIARLMRLRLPENFDRPFSATSFIDFWNRWHITLSTWLKTYVYNPLLLSLMRRTSSRSVEPWLGVLCFFVTWFLVGVWHGRTSEFLFFGFLQGFGVATNKLCQILMSRALGKKRYRELTKQGAYNAFSRGLTFTWFSLTTFWFWADWSQLRTIITGVAPWLCVGIFLALWIAATLILSSWEWLRATLLSIEGGDNPIFTSRYTRIAYVSGMAFTALVLTVLLNQPDPPIVYKAF
jgi:D-alanyl-lipoteichoic acid acyltransferase DltB (MBOAT superfamily)